MFNIFNKKTGGNMQYRIREFRKQKNMTQEELAEKSGQSRGTIIRLESGKDIVTTTETLEAIANALGVSLPLLFS